MASTPPSPVTPPPSAGMVDRIKNILISPKTEFPRIDAEPMTEKGIFTGWVLPLAAIGPVCSLIGQQVFGVFGIRLGLTYSLVTAVLTYVLAVVAVWIVAKIVDALAPSFGGTKNPVSALKVVAFSYTASFVAGVFGIFPLLGILAIIGGLYSLYLLYVGLPVLMKAPEDKALGYTVVTVLCAIVVQILVTFIAGAIAMSVVGTSMMMGAGLPTASGTATIPGVGSVDLGKLEAATKQLEAVANSGPTADGSAPAGAVKVVDPATLQALLPAAAAGWSRTSVESQSAGANGVAGSNAKGEYSRGSDVASLSVTDMGAMGALTALGNAFNIQSNKTTANGYERVGQVDGRMTTDKWDGESRHGEYSTVVANRFVVSVEGSADSADALKALASSIDLAQVAALAS